MTALHGQVCISRCRGECCGAMELWRRHSAATATRQRSQDEGYDTRRSIGFSAETGT